MNDWKTIFLVYGEDLDTDDELELFSESESEDYEEIPKLNI